ncbi:MAG: hypothetical protein WCS96_07935 [Victivallales bacterium]
MPRITDILRSRLLQDVSERMPDLNVLRRTERSPEFEKLRLNRKIIGAMRYGLMGVDGKKKYDRIGCMSRRLEEYRKDKNAEHLLDVANLAELEFVEGDGVLRPIDDGQHTKEL